jgi:sialate O-acetylesterase
MKSLETVLIIVFLAVIPAVQSVNAEVKLPSIIGENMVLQQKSSVPIWGWAEPGEKVTVKGDWMWLAASTKADKDGKWTVNISTPKASGPHTIEIKASNTIKLENVMTGEVWICSGQSNMEMGIAACDNAEEEIAAADYPNIRIFDVARKISTTPVDDCVGSWSECTPETIKSVGTWGGFSAAGYYFGREIHKELNVPVGLIATNWGGTPAEAWTSRETIEKLPDFKEALEAVVNYDAESSKAQYEQKLISWNAKLQDIEEGTKAGWERKDFDDSSWEKMELPKAWSETEFADYDGTIWFRSKVNLPPSWSRRDQRLTLGPIDDIDTVWVNNKLIGTTTRWDTPREYTVPASVLRTGPNIVAVRVIDTSGEGGFVGKKDQMKIRPVGAPDKSAATVAGDWFYKQGSAAADLPVPPQPARGFNANSPTSLYNGMLAPVIPFAIKGAIWYQGESNAYRAYQYRTLFPAMIKDWRKNFKRGDFPFYYVQIAPFKYGDSTPSEELREAQLLTLKTKNTGMAVIWDIGNIDDIHPRNKQDVGRRLALWALAKDYGYKDIVYSGPLYKSMKAEGDKIRLFFDHVGGGLVAKEGPLTHFTIAGEDKNFVAAEAVIDTNTIVVSSGEIKKPVAVRFAWSNTDEPNLFNKEGLPASSFRTDDWPGRTLNNK